MDCSFILPKDGPTAVALLNRRITARTHTILLVIGEEPENVFDLAVIRAQEKPESRLVIWTKNPDEPEIRREIDALSHGAADVLAIAINTREEIADVVYRGEQHLPIRFDIAFSLAEK